MKISHAILSLIFRLIPKSGRILVYSSFPDCSDNSYAMHEYLCRNRKGKYRHVWIYSDKESAAKYPKSKGFYKYSIKAFYYFSRAKYVFTTHGIYMFLDLKKDNKIVNLWHGMPLKKIGCMDPQSNEDNQGAAGYMVATSSFFQEIMAKSFRGMEIDRVLLVGQPRNDLMFEDTCFFKKRNIDPKGYSSIGVWLPTYRQSIIGDIRKDGIYNGNGISFLTMNELHRLDSFLQKTSSLLIVKIHPMDALQLIDFDNFKNLLIVKPKEFQEQLYPLLGASDYLLTDYSSVWIDYCILKRPIGFVMNDIKEYKDSRGLTIEELDKKLPGTIIDTYEKLTAFIGCRPKFDDRNSDIYNKYNDNKASERLAKKLGL